MLSLKSLKKISKNTTRGINKEIRDIKKYNQKLILKEIRDIFQKRATLKQKFVDHNTQRRIFRIELHEQTMKYNQTLIHMLQLFLELQKEYTFLDIHFARNCKCCAIIRFDLDDFVNFHTKSKSDQPAQHLIGSSSVKTNSGQVFLKNHKILQDELSFFLDKPHPDMFLNNKTDFLIRLDREAFKSPKSTLHFLELVRRFKNENPFIEISRFQRNLVRLTIYWGLYKYYLTENMPQSVIQQQKKNASEYSQNNYGVSSQFLSKNEESNESLQKQPTSKNNTPGENKLCYNLQDISLYPSMYPSNLAIRISSIQ